MMNYPKVSKMTADSLLTSYQVGTLLQVNPSSVNKWVKDGRIPAFRTPGGHRRIRAIDLVAFLRNHDMPVPAGLQRVSESERRVLWIDADQHQLDQVEQCIQNQDAPLALCAETDGIDGLLQIGIFKPHVVVLDVKAPHVDGLQLCRKLKAHHATQGIKVVLVTTQWDPNVEKQALSAGAMACVEKQMDPASVVSMITAQA